MTPYTKLKPFEPRIPVVEFDKIEEFLDQPLFEIDVFDVPVELRPAALCDDLRELQSHPKGYGRLIRRSSAQKMTMRLVNNGVLSNSKLISNHFVSYATTHKCQRLRNINLSSITCVCGYTEGSYSDKVLPDYYVVRYYYNAFQLFVPCLKCDLCLKTRARNWALKARLEVERSIRTWFGTLTLDPMLHLKHEALCRVELVKQGRKFDELTDVEQFKLLVQHFGALTQKWLKKVRKNSGSELIYLLVFERHRSGLPHAHVLVHERTPDKPVLYRQLTSAWNNGFSYFKLARDKSPRIAWYVCKYLTKALEARVRVSRHYGIRP